MRKRKWFIPAVLVSMLLIGGIAGGLVVAADDNASATQDQRQPSERYQALLDRACAIYKEKTGVAIDSEQLKDALEEARSELQEAALENWLQDLVEKGKITQEQADQYLEWWRSRPDIKLPLPGLCQRGRAGGMMWGKGPAPWGRPPCAPDASNEAGD